MLEKDKYVYESLKNVPCVYMIKNLNNNKLYIGSTKELRRRIYAHFLDLGRQKHRNPYLQSDYNLGHEFEVQILSDDPIHENYWIYKYNTADKSIGYNVVVHGMEGLRKGKLCSETMREKCRQRVPWNKGKQMSETTKLKLHFINLGNQHARKGDK